MRKLGKRGTRACTRNSIKHFVSCKHSAEKYYLVISIILGLIVLVIALFWIFQEYFGQDVINKETCSQSIILRNTVPEIQLTSGMTITSFKDKFPLKCKNDVLEIDYKNVSRAEKEIADKLVECWYLIGNGNSKIYPSSFWDKWNSFCLACSRIHINPEVRSYYSENSLSFEDAVKLPFVKGTSYDDYLRKQVPVDAFSLRNGFRDNAFSVQESDSNRGELLISKSGIYYPSKYDPNGGDIFVIISSLVKDKDKTNSALFFLQQKDLDKLSMQLISVSWLTDWFGVHSAKLCENWEGIPA